MICPSCGLTISPYVTKCNHCKKQISVKVPEPVNASAAKASHSSTTPSKPLSGDRKSKPVVRSSNLLRNLFIAFFIMTFIMKKMGIEFNKETFSNIWQSPATDATPINEKQLEEQSSSAQAVTNHHHTLAAYSTAGGQLEIARDSSNQRQFSIFMNGANIFSAPANYSGISVAAFWPKGATPFLYLIAFSTGEASCPVLFRVLDVRNNANLTDEFGNCSSNPSFKYANEILTLTFSPANVSGKTMPRLIAEYSSAGLTFRTDSANNPPSSAQAGLFEEGRTLANQGNFAAALAIWKPLAESGYAEAQYALGRMYARGDGVPRDFNMAKKWFSSAARQGHQASIDKLKLIAQRGDD